MSTDFTLKVIAASAVTLAIAAGVAAFTQYNSATALTAQLNDARTDEQRLRDQLAAASTDAQQAHSQAVVEQEQLQSTQARLAAEVRPDLPIKVGFRKSLMGSGKVALIQNISNHEIEVTLEVESPATGQQFHLALVIDPNQVKQVGRNEGWEFAPGQVIKLNNPKYRPISGTVGS